MGEELNVDEVRSKLIKLIEEKDKSINELKGRIDGVGTCLRLLIERLNISVIESRVSTVNNNFDSYEIKLDKLVRRIDLLENDLNQYFHRNG